MRVVAIGATGAAGAELVPLLLERGHELTVMAPGARLDRLAPDVRRVRASLLDGDVRPRLTRALAGADAVVNLATAVPRDLAAPGGWETNTRLRREGTLRVAQAARSAAVRLVQMSITMAYPDGGDGWLDESTPLDPSPAREPLVEPVVALEAAIRALPVGEVPWTILRAARFVGPGTIQDIERRRLREGVLRVPGDGRSFLSMVHVGDFASAVVAALERGSAGVVLNVSDAPIRRGDYLTRLAAAEDAPAPTRAAGVDPDLPSQRVDSTAARRVLGWRPCRALCARIEYQS